MSGIRVAVLILCAFWAHDAAGQGAGGNLLVGSAGDDLLVGTDGDDVLDPLTASPGGEDVVQGGLGNDILALPGVPWHYVFAAEGLGFRVTGPSDVNALVEDVEWVAFGVTGAELAAGATPLAIVESAALLPGSSADGVGRRPIALSDTVGGARGASRVVINLSDLLRNDYDPDVNLQTLTGLDVTFVTPIGAVTVLLDPSAIEAAGYEWVLYPLGLLVVDLDGTLTSDVTLRYRTRMTLQGTTFIDQSSEATVTIAPVGAVNDRVLGSFGGETFIPYARLLANDGPGAVFDRIFDAYVFGGTISDDPVRGGIVIDFPGFYPNDGSFEYAIAGSSERALVEVELRNSPPVAAAMARVVIPGTSFRLTFDEIRQHFGNFDPDGGNDFLVEVTGPTNTNGVTFQVFDDRVDLIFPADYGGGFVLNYTLSDQRLSARSLPSTISFLTTAPPPPTAVRDELDWGINGDVLALFPGYRRGFGQVYARELLANDTAMPGSVVAPAAPLDITPVGENPCPDICTAFEQRVLNSIGEGIPGFEGATSRSDLRFGFQFQRDFSGPETFSYTVVDPLGRTAPGLLTLRVNIHQPVLLDNVITIPIGAASVTVTAAEILANDTFTGTGAIAQINANALIQVVDSGMPIGGGKTEITSFTFTPDTTYQPLESFVFYVLVYDTAAAGGSASGWQTVRFRRDQPPVNTPPVGVDDAVSTAFETPVVIPVLANDTDAENNPLSAGAFANLVGGTLSQPGDGTVVFTPAPNFVGTGGFTYRPYDGQAQGNVTTVRVEVRPATQEPRISVRVVGTTARAATVDLEVTNVGGSTASNVVIDRIRLRRLAGKGAIRLQTPVPIAIGTLASGQRHIVTVALTVDPRVQRFSITERGRFVNPAGRTRRFVSAQTVIP